MTGIRFAIVPIEAAGDSRLSKTDYRVLIAIFAIAGKSKSVYVKRSILSQMTGLTERNISKSTARLVEIGWLSKRGNGGRNRPAKYEIMTEKTLSGLDRVQDETLSSLDRDSGLNHVKSRQGKEVKTLSGLDRGKEKKLRSKCSGSKERNEISLANLPAGISADAATEFITHRKNLKKPLTQNAFNRAMAQAIKASDEINISPNEAIHESIDAGWAGIKAEWLKNRMGKVNGTETRWRSSHQSAGQNAADFHEHLKQIAAREMDSGTVFEDSGEVWPRLVSAVDNPGKS